MRASPGVRNEFRLTVYLCSLAERAEEARGTLGVSLLGSLSSHARITCKQNVTVFPSVCMSVQKSLLLSLAASSVPILLLALVPSATNGCPGEIVLECGLDDFADAVLLNRAVDDRVAREEVDRADLREELPAEDLARGELVEAGVAYAEFSERRKCDEERALSPQAGRVEDAAGDNLKFLEV